MSGIETFLASPEDAEVLAGLQIEFDAEFDTPSPTHAQLARRFGSILSRSRSRDDAYAVLAGRRDAPDGYALVTLRPTVYSDGPLAVLDELYVRPALRAGGIGTAILGRVIRELRERGGEEMHINVDEVDVDTRRFYERHGFTNIQPGADYRMLLYLGEFPAAEAWASVAAEQA